MYKAVFIDIDGTLRSASGEISKRNIEAIKDLMKKGILIVLCSGRPRHYVLDISKKSFASKYIISSNGAEIYNTENGKIISIDEIPKEAIFKICSLCVKQNIRFTINAGDIRYLNKYWHDDSKEIIINFNRINEYLKDKQVTQIVVSEDKLDKMFYIKETLRDILNEYDLKIGNESRNVSYNDINSTENSFMDITRNNVSKGNAIIKFCKIMNIDIKDTIAIGDDNNDISMFKVAGYGVAMENATDKLKEISNEITRSNNENGVALFLEKIINTL